MINSGSFGSILCAEFRISGIQVAMNSPAGGLLQPACARRTAVTPAAPAAIENLVAVSSLRLLRGLTDTALVGMYPQGFHQVALGLHNIDGVASQ